MARDRQAAEQDMEIEKVFLIPHFHFDFEWWKEEPYHQGDAVPIIRRGLELLAKHPRFTFVIDTALVLKYFLEKEPGAVGRIKRYVDEGRLELVGGGLVSPDEGLPTGEGLVRQFWEGKQWYRETLGLDIKVAWEIDEFSHPAQMPQIMSMVGFDYFVFCRGVHPYDAPHPTLFRWASPFGKRKVTAYWWAAHYISASPRSGSKKERLERFFKEMRVRIPYEGARSPVPYLMIPLGDDFAVPSEDWIEFVDRWNETESVPLVFSTPSAYFKLIEKEDIPEIAEEFPPIYSGYFSSRERLKKRCRELEYRLSSAEKLLSLSHALGAPYPEGEMKRAWWEVLKGDFHDTICGTGTDRVYRKSLERYARAQKIVDRCLEKNDAFLGRMLSGDHGFVMNPCNWERREVVEIDGRPAVVAAPPLGVASVRPEPIGRSGLSVGPASVENGHVRVSVDGATGAVGIYDTERNMELFGPGGNRIVVEDDIGNLWASMPTGKTRPLSVKKITVKGKGGHAGEITVELACRAAAIKKRIVLSSDRKEVRFVVDVDFFGKDKRIVDTFPFSFAGTFLGEEPFLISEKGKGTWPLQNCLLYEGSDYRVALVNRGIPGHELSDGRAGLVLFRSVSMMSLLWLRWLGANFFRTVRLLRKALALYRSGFNTFEFPLYPIHHVALRDFASEGGTGGVGAEDGREHLLARTRFFREARSWERGRHRFEYAILPDVADAGEAARKGYEFNNPLVVRQGTGTGKRGGASILAEGTDPVIVTGVHPYRDGLVFRCYEPGGKPAHVRFSFGVPVVEAYLMETAGGRQKKIPLAGGTFAHDFSPYEIASFYLLLKRGAHGVTQQRKGRPQR